MLILTYLIAIILANLLITALGPAAAIPIAFLFIGLDLTTRDALDEKWHGRKAPMLILIATGGAISYLLNREAGSIAIASTIAFTAAAIADWSVYHLLSNHSQRLRVNGSNIAGAAIDSILFPTIAFGVFLPLIIVGQFIAKVFGGAFWYEVLHVISIRRL